MKPITREDIAQLSAEAASAGDLAQVEICKLALEHGETSDAWFACAKVITDAHAMRET